MGHDSRFITGGGGSVELVCGPMFSGKTSELMRRVKRYSIPYENILIIKKINLDSRYSQDYISSHDQDVLDKMTFNCDTVMEGYQKYLSYRNNIPPDVIGIDEGQFFPDLVDSCESIANKGTIVIVAMLDGKFDRTMWIGNETEHELVYRPIYEIFSIADKVDKLLAVCNICKSTDAPFTKYIANGDHGEVDMGGIEKYNAVCRKCFFL